MLKTAIRPASLVCLILFPLNLYAAPEKTIFIGGYKGWQASWSLQLPSVNGASVNADAEKEISKGPALIIRDKGFFAGMNEFKGSYTFNSVQSADVSGALYTTDWKFEREDTEKFLGYDLSSYLSIIYGKKEITLHHQYVNTSSPSATFPSEKLDAVFNGKYYAVSARTKPDQDGLAYVLTYSKLSLDLQGVSSVFGDIDGTRWDVGATIFPRGDRFFYGLNYRKQTYDYNGGGSEESSGFGASIHYVF